MREPNHTLKKDSRSAGIISLFSPYLALLPLGNHDPRTCNTPYFLKQISDNKKFQANSIYRLESLAASNTSLKQSPGFFITLFQAKGNFVPLKFKL